MLNKFNVRIGADSETITGSVSFPNGRPPGSEIAFYLSKNGRIVERRKYSYNNSAVFLLQGSGEYVVKGFVRRGDEKVSKNSSGYQHLQSKLGRSEAIPSALKYTTLAYPHRDHAVIMLASESLAPDPAAVASLREQTGLDITRLDIASSPTFIVHHPDAEVDPKRAYFSGMACSEDQFIFGPHDVPRSAHRDLVDTVGDFTYITAAEDSVEIGSDYFGVGKLYYFSRDGVSCATNRTHLLFLILRALGIKLAVSASFIRANLQAATQVFTQTFARSIGLEGCYSLLPGERLTLAAGALHIGASEIAGVLEQRTNQSPDAAEYEELIAAGSSEIERNLRLALEHPNFSRIRVDLTGGLDSRTLTAALSRMPHLDHVELHTADFASSPNDLPISLRMSRSLPFPYDTGERAIYDIDADTVLLENISMHLGTYYGLRAEGTRTRLPGTLCINGFFGEAAMRPYFARLLFGKDEETLDVRDFPHDHVDKISEFRRPVLRDHDLQSEFRREFDSLPGNSPTSRFDSLYLFHRNGLHCSDRWLSHVRASSWGPLQTKSLFALKWRTLDSYRSIKVQVDVTERLNSRIAHIPLGREKDNADRAALDDTYPASVDSLLDPTESDRHRFAIAGRERRKVARRLEGPGSEALRTKNASRLKRHLGWLLSGIDELEAGHGILSLTEAAELRAYVKREYSRPQGNLGQAGTVITSKILSAVYMCREANVI